MRIVIFAALTILAAPAGAQDKYRLPPPDVVKLVDAPPTPRVSISPDSRWMLEVGTFLLRSESELVIKSRNVIPGRLVSEGFRFRFPQFEDAIPDLTPAMPQI